MTTVCPDCGSLTSTTIGTRYTIETYEPYEFEVVECTKSCGHAKPNEDDAEQSLQRALEEERVKLRLRQAMAVEMQGMNESEVRCG